MSRYRCGKTHGQGPGNNGRQQNTPHDERTPARVRSRALAWCWGIAAAVAWSTPALSQEAAQDTVMLAMPSAAAQSLVFVYDNDVWLSAAEGGVARRLTSADGREIQPTLSPDGATLAFSAPYAGNQDVYVMPAQGGPLRRLTWHPGDDIVRGFTPDGTAVLFESPRSVHTRRYRHLYSVPVEGGVPQRLAVPTAFKAALSPDGRYLAYTPAREAFNQWKNYRGGTISRIWIMNLDDSSVQEVPKPAGGSNDTDPMWVGDTLYFNSDRAGEFNLFRFDRASGEVSQLTQLTDFPVLNPSATADGIVFEHAGRLHRYRFATGQVASIRVQALSPLQQTLPRQVSDKKWVRAVEPAPDLQRVVVEYRGEIVTVPAEKGDPRVLAPNSGAHDRNPVWSPRGDQVAWFSDASGEYALYVAGQDGRGEPRRYEVDGAGYYDQPRWSPDGQWLAYRDNSQSLWVIRLDDGKTYKVAQEPVYTPLNLMTMAWSPDSRWLAYTVQKEGLIRTVYAWSSADKESVQITDGLSETAEPVFDPNGEHLYVLASTDAGPLKDWFSQASVDQQIKYGVYVITLRRDGPHPLPPQSDEVAVKGIDSENGKGNGNGKNGGQKPDGKNGDKKKAGPPTVRIDEAGLQDRIVALPVPHATRHGLQVGKSGEVFFIESVGKTSFDAFDSPGELKRYSIEKRKIHTLAGDVAAFRLSADGSKILYQKNGGWHITEVADELKGNGKLDLERIVVQVDPRQEWRQIFEEAWRINRDWFYDPGYHGADWPAMREKYRAFLPHLATREDLERVIQWMLSELAVGHSYQSPGDHPDAPEEIAVGLLGADYHVENNRYRLRKVYGGLNWNADLRAPLRAPGVHVEAGDYLLAVNGVEVRPPQNLYQAFVNQTGRQVTIRVADNPAGREAREYTVVPVGDEGDLRYLDWLESNLRYVDEQSDGRVAYVHVPNTAGYGHTLFKRYFYPQSHKQAIIVDERYNGGGLVADYYIDILRRPFIAQWTMRYGADHVSPRAAIFGPKVMLIDEGAGSGGDLLPWMFRRFELGPLIGKRTWGGLVGILGFPVLMDGATVTAPNLAFRSEQGFNVENEGVAPDIEVEQWPADVNAGRDPQLERALQEVLQVLEENPPQLPPRPPFPRRAR